MANAMWDLVIRATDEDYPLVVHAPHSVLSVARYRQWRESEGEPQLWLYDMLVSCFTHSQGGGISAKALVNGTTLVHNFGTGSQYLPVQALAYILAYWSPGDIVYRSLTTPRHPARMFCVSMDALDTVTTACGLVDTCRSSFPQNRLIPLMATAVLFNSGSVFRYLDAKGRGKQAKVCWAEPGSDLTRALVVGIMYYYVGRGFRRGAFRNRALVAISLSYTILEMLEDWFDFDAFEQAHKPTLSLLRVLRRIFRLGPQPARVALDAK